ncbi:MAG: hypothetical protein BWX99_01493 [Deltaproteobacteria bacterium ADurb.Bin151]|nr:PilZ domain-containing protein [Smithella sp.]OQB55212.1 MAG: hypothetical protein BWX99_01493 [Deltaproteobacteria bacterium ADurb.Bin151]
MNQRGPIIVEQVNEQPDPDVVDRPLYFHHHDLVQNLDAKKTVSQRKLINLWNNIHFMDGTVQVHLRHYHNNKEILVEAYPVPCSDQSMTCYWPEKNRSFVENAKILNIILMDGLTVFLLPAKIKDSQEDHFTITIPDKAYVLGKRQARHFNCHGVRATLVQDGFQAQGQLTDFSSRAFTIKVRPEGIGSFRWFNADRLSTINLYRNGRMVCSVYCRCIRQTADQGIREIVFSPTTSQINRFLKKKWRNPRVGVNPRPNITFEHPLISKNIQLDIKNLSSSGFSIELSAEEDVLMPGMIIQDLKMNFSGALPISCKAQVLYRRREKKNLICYGFVILDMDVVAYNRLSHIVMNILDPSIHVADEVDADRLWEFLFDSGFIYPQKYNIIHANRQMMKQTYQRLYRDNPEITTQITYQRNGRIYGHASMIRSYRRTWMVHHLAARPLGKKRTGLQVLKSIMHYFNGLYRLPTVGMDYMMFYFRPENSFPDHFFGGFARHFKNPRACSMDLFSYLNYPTTCSRKPLPNGWSLGECTATDLEELDFFYRNTSNGLLLDVLRLDKDSEEGVQLAELYARQGFIRSCHSLALSQHGRVKAVLVVNQSNVGLSLSDFLNGLKILVTDAAGLPWPVLSAAISQVVGCYRVEQIPILVYPSDYFKTQEVPFFQKKYNLWIIDAHRAREYSEYMMENIKFRIRFVIRHLLKKYKGT